MSDIALTVGAAGTLLLALATFWLAKSTRKVADETAEELRAQWRPVLIPADSSRLLGIRDLDNALVMTIRNGGRGPALYVRAQLDPLGMSPDDWGRAAVADGAEAELVFSHVPQLPAAMQLLLDYRDLTGRTYSTAIVITVNVGQHQERRISFYDVRTFRDTTLTTHGDSLPQAGLRVRFDKLGHARGHQPHPPGDPYRAATDPAISN
jgi:hypothetical protein